MNKKKQLWNMDKQGNLNFHTRNDLVGSSYAPDSGWEKPVAAIIIMLICAALDFAVFKQLFAAILYDKKILQIVSVAGALIAFDLAPIYLGILMKKWKQGFRIDWITAFGLLAAFVLVCAGNVWLRITVKDILVPNSSAASFSVFSGTEETGSAPAALPYAIFSSFLPLATSLVSYGASFISANPLKARLRRLHEQQVELEDAVGQLDAIVREYEEDAELASRLTQEDDLMFLAANDRTTEFGYLYADYVRERIKEQLGDPAASNELSKDVRERLEQMLGKAPELPAQSEESESTNPHVFTTKEVA